MRNRSTIEYLGLWGQLNNVDFNSIEFDGIKNQAGANSFSLTPNRIAQHLPSFGGAGGGFKKKIKANFEKIL